jgi:hypothetical protein
LLWRGRTRRGQIDFLGAACGALANLDAGRLFKADTGRVINAATKRLTLAGIAPDKSGRVGVRSIVRRCNKRPGRTDITIEGRRRVVISVIAAVRSPPQPPRRLAIDILMPSLIRLDA